MKRATTTSPGPEPPAEYKREYTGMRPRGRAAGGSVSHLIPVSLLPSHASSTWCASLVDRVSQMVSNIATPDDSRRSWATGHGSNGVTRDLNRHLKCSDTTARGRVLAIPEAFEGRDDRATVTGRRQLQTERDQGLPWLSGFVRLGLPTAADALKLASSLISGFIRSKIQETDF